MEPPNWPLERPGMNATRPSERTSAGRSALPLAAQAAEITAIHVIEPVQVIITLWVSALTTQTHQGEHYA